MKTKAEGRLQAYYRLCLDTHLKGKTIEEALSEKVYNCVTESDVEGAHEIKLLRLSEEAESIQEKAATQLLDQVVGELTEVYVTEDIVRRLLLGVSMNGVYMTDIGTRDIVEYLLSNGEQFTDEELVGYVKNYPIDVGAEVARFQQLLVDEAMTELRDTLEKDRNVCVFKRYSVKQAICLLPGKQDVNGIPGIKLGVDNNFFNKTMTIMESLWKKEAIKNKMVQEFREMVKGGEQKVVGVLKDYFNRGSFLITVAKDSLGNITEEITELEKVKELKSSVYTLNIKETINSVREEV